MSQAAQCSLASATVLPLSNQYKFGFSKDQVALAVKNLPADAEDIRDAGSMPGQEDPLEEGMATYSSILAWRIPCNHRVAKESDMTKVT